MGEDTHADLRYSCYGQSQLRHHDLHGTSALDDVNDDDEAASVAAAVGSMPTRLNDDVLDLPKCSAPSN